MKSPVCPTILPAKKKESPSVMVLVLSFPFEKQDLAELVKNYFGTSGTRISKFEDNRSGDSWYQSNTESRAYEFLR